MEQTTTQSPPAGTDKPANDNAASTTKALAFHREGLSHAPFAHPEFRFRIAIVIAIVVLLVIGFFAYRYFTSYESTDDAQVDGHINSISARVPATSSN